MGYLLVRFDVNFWLSTVDMERAHHGMSRRQGNGNISGISGWMDKAEIYIRQSLGTVIVGYA